MLAGICVCRRPHFSLEGHDKGVNCIDYYPGGDKVRRAAREGGREGHHGDIATPWPHTPTIMAAG